MAKKKDAPQRPTSFVELGDKWRKEKKAASGSDIAQWEYIPTGIYELDRSILGLGGIPIGAMTGVAGTFSAGKSSWCLHMTKQAQALGGAVAYVDIEKTFDPAYAEKMGVDLSRDKFILVDRVRSGEEAYQVMLEYLRLAKLIILDSVATALAGEEIGKSMEDKEKVGSRALMNRRCLTKVLWGAQDDVSLRYSGTAIILVNHLTTNIMKQWGDKNEESGGSGVKNLCSIMNRSSRYSTKNGVTTFGIRNVKNKCALPLQKTEIFLDLQRNAFWPCNVETWISLASVAGLDVSVGRGSVTVQDVKLRGKSEVAQYLDEHPELVSTVMAHAESVSAVEEDGDAEATV